MESRPIRVAAKAVVVDGGRILLTRNLHPDDPEGEFYLLPGGGQDYGEPLADCLRREVCEETGYSVEVGDVLWVRDYIGARHEFAAYERDVHQVEIMFACTVDHTRPPVSLVAADTWQLSVEWVPVGDLTEVRLFPNSLVPELVRWVGERWPGAGYLGDVN
jgi:ADP-ribose pyrophosphatase YjhB (NUDIX family)